MTREQSIPKVARLIVDAVVDCQAELVCCFDLLCESDVKGLKVPPELEDTLFAAHRAMNQLRLVAESKAAPKVCRLLER